jgi:shikimate kinase
MTARHVVLVGLMGSGKTTTGRLLAEALSRPLVDSDLLIEATTGRTVREIFATDGEAAFRTLETAALVEALGRPEPLVIAAAGGVVLREENRRALLDADAFVVWLQADLAVLESRAATGVHRPLLDDDPAGALRQMSLDRAERYAEVADAAVDTTARPPDVVVAEILRVLDLEEEG